MNKIKLVLIALMTVVLSGCYSTFRTTGYSYEQSDEVVYIDYNFECSHCYYETYFCFNCTIFHVSINTWCNHHYNWYTTWYSYNYHRPHGYYYRHWKQHRHYRDATRHYVRDRSGIRKYRGDVKRIVDDKTDVKKKRDIYRDKKVITKRKDIKKKREIYDYKKTF